MLTNNPLLDKSFLKDLDLEKNKELFVKLVSLNINEEPVEEIQGRATSGSITIDGNSAVRRTCNISLVSEQININNYDWSLHTKFKVYIGLKNNINPIYDDIIWFKQGTFVITSFSSQYNVNSYNINISGQDKMCLLNGTIGGSLPGQVDFKYQILDNNIYEPVDLGPRYLIDGITYYINNKGTYSLDTAHKFNRDIYYYKKTGTNQYTYVDLSQRDYAFDTYYIYTPAKNQFEFISEGYDKNSHYFIKINNQFEEIRFENFNYQAHKYYTYDYVNNVYSISDDEYDPVLQYYEKTIYTDKKTIPIKTIVREAVHTYAEEPYYNIVINNVDDYGLQLMEYRNEEPLFLFLEDGICINTTLQNDIPCLILKDGMPREGFESLRDLVREEFAYIEQEYAAGSMTAEEAETARNSLNEYFVNKVATMTDSINMQYATTIDDDINIVYDTLLDDYNINPSYIMFPYDQDTDIESLYTLYTIAKLEYGEAAGYKQIDLIYPDDLISSLGDTLVTILDKIKSQFTDFEYFYNIDGQFVFQKKQTYLNTSWNNIVKQDDGVFVDNTVATSASQYKFDNNELIISLSHTPDIGKLRNDFSVWGTRKGITGADIAIHARYAIDKKPTYYKTFPRTKYNYQEQRQELKILYKSNLKFLEQHIYYSTDSEEYQELLTKLDLNPDTGEPVDICTLASEEFILEPFIFKHFGVLPSDLYAGIHLVYHYCDWRELIYQMAKDYYQYNQFDDFEYYLKMFNPELCQNGKTGYEKYYIDIEGFWRELYNPEPEIDFTQFQGKYVTSYDYDKKSKKIIELDGWKELILDYSDLQCNYYLPNYKKNEYNTALQNLQDFYSGEIAKWQAAYDSIKPSIANNEKTLTSLQKSKIEKEQKKEQLFKTMENDSTIQGIKNNLATINANIQIEEENLNEVINKQQVTIKDNLLLFGL